MTTPATPAEERCLDVAAQISRLLGVIGVTNLSISVRSAESAHFRVEFDLLPTESDES